MNYKYSIMVGDIRCIGHCKSDVVFVYTDATKEQIEQWYNESVEKFGVDLFKECDIFGESVLSDETIDKLKDHCPSHILTNNESECHCIDSFLELIFWFISESANKMFDYKIVWPSSDCDTELFNDKRIGYGFYY